MPIAVTFYTQIELITGQVDQSHEERFSDILNNAALPRPEDSDRFLRIANARITRPGFGKQNLPAVFINKAVIQMAAMMETDLARGLGAKEGNKPYPFIPKSPVPVKVRLPNYEIMGSMYCAAGQGIEQVLEDKLMFLPLTSVKMRGLDSDVWQPAYFTAVNRGLILSLQPEEVTYSS